MALAEAPPDEVFANQHPSPFQDVQHQEPTNSRALSPLPEDDEGREIFRNESAARSGKRLKMEEVQRGPQP